MKNLASEEQYEAILAEFQEQAHKQEQLMRMRHRENKKKYMFYPEDSWVDYW